MASGLFPDVVHETLAAVLLVDLNRAAVTYTNGVAEQLAPGVQLPIGVDDWSRAAGLKSFAGEDLDADEGSSHPLSRVAAGEPVYGEAVTAARASDSSDAREPLWVLGLPMTGGPQSVAHLAVVVFLPLRDAGAVAGAQERAAALRDRALSATRISFTISDPSQEDNPLIWVNPAFTDTTGYTLEDSLGRNCRFLQGPDTDRRVVAEMRSSIERGAPLTTTVLNYRKDGTPFWNQISISPVHDAEGRVTHHVGVQTDVSDRVHAERSREAALVRAENAGYRLNLIASFARDLASALSPEEVVRRTSRFLVPRLGTWCVTFVVDEEGRLQTPSVVHERATDPEVAGAVERLVSRLPHELSTRGPIHRILTGADGHLLVQDASDPRLDESLLNSPDSADEIRSLGMTGMIAVPLIARGSVIGALAVITDERRPTPSVEDLTLVTDLAGRAALAYDNAVLYTRQRDASEILQRGLLPSIPTLPGVEICAEYLPATAQVAVGGDWYDVFRIADGRLGVTVGDVMGHDLNAAANMGQFRSALLAYAYANSSAAEVVDQLDALVTGLDLGQLATCVYGTLELDDGHGGDGGAVFSWSSAGHPPPLLVDPDGGVRALTGGLERMIGVSKLVDRPTARPGDTVRVPAGATLVCYTDGLLDAFGTDLEDALAQLVDLLGKVPPGAACGDMVTTLVERVDGSGRTDDVAVLALTVTGRD